MTLLVPERMLVFSPALAATIGLEEAILLHQLHDLVVSGCAVDGTARNAVSGRADQAWHAVEGATLERLLPFWNRADLQRIAASLAAKGIAQIEPGDVHARAQFRFNLASGAPTVTAAPVVAASAMSSPARSAFSPAHPVFAPERSAAPAHTADACAAAEPDAHAHHADIHPAKNTSVRGASLLPSNWQPQADTLQLLALKNIPRQFAIEQLEEFVLYWRERGKAEYAWDNKFRKHVIERWQRSQQQTGAAELPAATPDSVWYPSVDALQILERTGISRQFIEDTIPEFVLYWRERGDNTGTWNSKFIAHIRRQWARYSNALEHDQEPRPIAANWQPSEDVYDILRMANIDIAFACELLPEFILFWRDAGTPQRSWNTKFLQHVKYQWATRHHLTGANRAGYSLSSGGSSASGAAAAAPASAFERLTDRSWASGLVEGV